MSLHHERIKLEGCGLNIDFQNNLHTLVLVGVLGQNLGDLDSCSYEHELVVLHREEEK